MHILCCCIRAAGSARTIGLEPDIDISGFWMMETTTTTRLSIFFLLDSPIARKRFWRGMDVTLHLRFFPACRLAPFL